ncbi:hypothetical protein ABH968_004116 [Lysinibacillus sp. RC79]
MNHMDETIAIPFVYYYFNHLIAREQATERRNDINEK